jgi:hypothetical protein
LSVNDSLVSEIVQKTLKENEFIDEVADWEGSNVSVCRDDLKYVVQIRAVNRSIFCAFKECEKERNGKLIKSQNCKPHTSSEKAVLRQSCFNCQKPELQEKRRSP